jgi:drug/metabolite transporter (DMT)-like permease
VTRTATLALLAATAVWGATFVTVKDALASSDSFTFLALRFGVGAVSAFFISLALERPTRAQWKSVLRPGLLLGVILFGGYAFQTVGLETTTPARSAFVTGLTVIFVPFVSWKLTGQRPPTRAFIASAIALLGLQRLTGVSFSDPVPPGDVLTLGCAVLYAGHIAGTSKLGKGLPPLALTSLQLAIVSVLSIASLPFVARKFEPTGAYWGAVLFTGIVASAVAIGVQVWAQTKMSAVRAAVVYALEPVFAIAWALMTGLGWPTSSELVGGAFILAAVFVSEVEVALPRNASAR